MIFKRPTVIILGAGASKQFGFPLGPELKDLVIAPPPALRLKRDTTPGLTAHQKNLLQLVIPEDLRNAGQSTIDEYLAMHADYRELGKLAIAWVIFNAEAADRSGRLRGWYLGFFSKLFDLIDCNLGEVERLSSVVAESLSRVTVVSFNYDRSFEHWLWSALGARYGQILTKEERTLIASSIHVHHVFGRVGRLGYLATNTNEPVGRYGKPSRDQILDLARCIRVPTEEELQTELLNTIKERLLAADQVLITGFGYHLPHMSLLDFPDTLRGKNLVLGTYRHNQIEETIKYFNRCEPSDMQSRPCPTEEIFLDPAIYE